MGEGHKQLQRVHVVKCPSILSQTTKGLEKPLRGQGWRECVNHSQVCCIISIPKVMSLSCKQTSRYQCALIRLSSSVSDIARLRGSVGGQGSAIYCWLQMRWQGVHSDLQVNRHSIEMSATWSHHEMFREACQWNWHRIDPPLQQTSMQQIWFCCSMQRSILYKGVRD